jgi:hypothetical protein
LDVNTIYEICKEIVGKNQNGYLDSDQFNLLINQAQTSYMAFLLGETQQYQYDKGKPRVDYSLNEDSRQRVMPFWAKETLSITNGSVNYPINYLQIDAMLNSAETDRIRYAAPNKWYSFVKSKIDPIATNPIYRLTDTGFIFAPATLASATLWYISVPNEIVWNYTIDINGREVYNPSSSVDPKWYDTDIFEIIARALSMIGISLQSAAVMQYAAGVKTNGQ